MAKKMVMPQSLFPRRYFINDEGGRVLIGLTVEQTREFELLEVPEPSSEIDRANQGRWLELYRLHQQAWEIWKAQTSAASRSGVAAGQLRNRAAIRE